MCPDHQDLTVRIVAVGCSQLGEVELRKILRDFSSFIIALGLIESGFELDLKQRIHAMTAQVQLNRLIAGARTRYGCEQRHEQQHRRSIDPLRPAHSFSW